MNMDEAFHGRDKIFAKLKKIILNQGEPLPWEDVSEDEIIKFYLIMKVARKGYSSWDEIPDTKKASR